MKYYILVLLAFCTFSNQAKADIGNLAYLSLEISFDNSANRTLYISIPEYGIDLDSIDQSDYLMEVLLSWNTFQDSSMFFNKWSNYTYIPKWNENEDELTIVGLSQPENIPLTSIKTLSVLNYHFQSAAMGLLMPSKENSQPWLNKEVKREIHAYSYSCDFTLFQYEESPEINKLILNFINACQETEDFDSQNDVFGILEELSGFGIVILTMCTC